MGNKEPYLAYYSIILIIKTKKASKYGLGFFILMSTEGVLMGRIDSRLFWQRNAKSGKKLLKLFKNAKFKFPSYCMIQLLYFRLLWYKHGAFINEISFIHSYKDYQKWNAEARTYILMSSYLNSEVSCWVLEPGALDSRVHIITYKGTQLFKTAFIDNIQKRVCNFSKIYRAFYY